MYAGFLSAERDPESVLSRLSRELTAQAISADSFKVLATKRAQLLDALYEALGDEFKSRKVPSNTQSVLITSVVCRARKCARRSSRRAATR